MNRWSINSLQFFQSFYARTADSRHQECRHLQSTNWTNISPYGCYLLKRGTSIVCFSILIRHALECAAVTVIQLAGAALACDLEAQAAFPTALRHSAPESCVDVDTDTSSMFSLSCGYGHPSRGKQSPAARYSHVLTTKYAIQKKKVPPPFLLRTRETVHNVCRKNCSKSCNRLRHTHSQILHCSCICESTRAESDKRLHDGRPAKQKKKNETSSESERTERTRLNNPEENTV